MNQGKNTVGVIVGRFQVDALHKGHIDLIHQVQERHGKVLICIGSANTRLTERDPLDIPTRSRMLSSAFPGVTLAFIHDCRSDLVWSINLDALVTEVFPTDKATLYGSSDSFLTHYMGRLDTKELDGLTVPRGTYLREQILQNVIDSPDFRAGVIFGVGNRWPISYQCIDVAIIGDSGDRVLLGRKKGEDMYRFICGVLGTPDRDLAATVKREVTEETGVEVGDVEYICSARIDDWRYRKSQDKLMTAFFVAKYIFGSPQGVDDIVEAKWIPLKNTVEWANETLLPEHRFLGQALINWRFPDERA